MKLSTPVILLASIALMSTSYLLFFKGSEEETKLEEPQNAEQQEDNPPTYSQAAEELAWRQITTPGIKPMPHPNAVVEITAINKDNPNLYEIQVNNMELLTNPVLEDSVVFHTGPDQSFTAKVSHIKISRSGNKTWTADYEHDEVSHFSQVTAGEHLILATVTDGKYIYNYHIDKSTGKGTILKIDTSKITKKEEVLYPDFQSSDIKNIPSSKKLSPSHKQGIQSQSPTKSPTDIKFSKGLK